MNLRRRRLAAARLYLVCDVQADEFLDAVLRGGVDIVQLRAKTADDETIVAAGRRFKQIAARHDALLILNDRPDLVAAIDADGAHLGQDDLPPAEARRIIGAERLLGLSTHSPDQIAAAAEAGIDYIGVGPVNETPTKPGRPAVGVELVRHAAAHATVPFFAIGGISEVNLDTVHEAGADRVAVVRALTTSTHPGVTARRLRARLEMKREAAVGTT